MKFWFYGLLVTLTSCKCSSDRESSIVATAISQLVNHVFRDPNDEFDFVLVKAPEIGRKTYEIFDQTLKLIQVSYAQLTQQISDDNDDDVGEEGSGGEIKDTKVSAKYLNRSAVVFYESWNTYRNFTFDSRLKTLYPKQLYFLVVVNEPTDNLEREIQSVDIFSKRSYTRIHHEYFLIISKEKDEAMTLKTVEKFRQPNCKKYQEIEINQFSSATMKWKSQKFTQKKYENFNGCEMEITKLYRESTSSLALQIDSDKNGRLLKARGYISTLHKIISRSLNYTYRMWIAVKNESTSLNDFERELTKAIRDFRLEISSYRRNLQLQRTSLLSTSDRYTTVDEIILVSRFEPYSMFEKIFLPFEVEVWLWLIGTVVAFLLVSAVASFLTPKFVKRFIFGYRVKHPTLNIM
jgi:hypothetical protein